MPTDTYRLMTETIGVDFPLDIPIMSEGPNSKESLFLNKINLDAINKTKLTLFNAKLI